MIVLNEKKYAEECLENGTVDKKPFFTLSILAKYYHHMGYSQKKIYNALVEFAEQNCYEYHNNKAMWESSIMRLAKRAGKNPLYEIDGIWISSKELETIDSIHNKVLERLAFTLLCLAKLGMERNANNCGWVGNDSKEIFQLARITDNTVNRELRLNDLYQMGLISFAKRIDNLSIKVDFIDNSDKTLFISDFRELGYEYLKYCGKNYIRCKCCGILTKGNKAHTKTLCTDCAKYEPITQKKIECVDCGKVFWVSPSNNQSNRCKECYSIYRKKYKAQKEKERREKVEK